MYSVPNAKEVLYIISENATRIKLLREEALLVFFSLPSPSVCVEPQQAL